MHKFILNSQNFLNTRVNTENVFVNNQNKILTKINPEKRLNLHM
jgi:hypothetical protein